MYLHMHTCNIFPSEKQTTKLENIGVSQPRISRSLSDLHPQHQWLNIDCCNGMFDGFGDDKVNEAPGNEDGNGSIILHHFTQVQKDCPGTSGNQTWQWEIHRNPPNFRFHGGILYKFYKWLIFNCHVWFSEGKPANCREFFRLHGGSVWESELAPAAVARASERILWAARPRGWCVFSTGS